MLTLVILLAAAGAGAAAEPPIDVPVILPLTGGNAFAGIGQRTALALLQELVNRGGGIHGRSIVFDVHDSGSSSQVAVQLLHQFVSADVPVFIGDSSLATCAAIAAQVQGSGPVDFCLSPGLVTKLDGFAFAPGHPSTQIAAGVLGYLRARHLKRVALIVATDATGMSMDGYFVDVFAQPKNRDLTLVTREHFNPTDLSVDAQITRIKAAGAQQVRKYVRGLHDFPGVQGMYDFRNGDGHGAPDLSMLQWDPGKNAWFIASGVGAGAK